MPIQHRDIPDGERHEPKGISAALSGQAYFSNGSGQGVWKKVSTSEIQGLGASPGSDRRVLSDGTGGFRYVLDAAVGFFRIQGNTNALTIATPGGPDLIAATGYQNLTGTGAPIVPGINYFVGFDTDSLNITISGAYEVTIWANITEFPANDSKVALRWKKNNSELAVVKPMAGGALTTSCANISATDQVELQAGDNLRLAVAATAAGSVKISDLVFSVSLIRSY